MERQVTYRLQEPPPVGPMGGRDGTVRFMEIAPAGRTW
jgi:hypothetical protein